MGQWDLTDRLEGYLHQWAEARAGGNAKLAEALHTLVSAYLSLRELGETGALREFTDDLLRLPNDPAHLQQYLLDAKLRGASGLSGGEIYKRLRALEAETGLKFAALDRRRRQLQRRDN
jgi:hypothetical protein